MFPQVMDLTGEFFRQYLVGVGIVPTIGLTPNSNHKGILIIDPNFQRRYICFFINGRRYPASDQYLLADRMAVSTPSFELPYDMTTTVDNNSINSPEGFILVQILKGMGEKDGAKPSMQAEKPTTEGEASYFSVPKTASIAKDVPKDLVATDNCIIRVVSWLQLSRVARPTTTRSSWGPPLRSEHHQVNQYWNGYPG